MLLCMLLIGFNFKHILYFPLQLVVTALAIVMMSSVFPITACSDCTSECNDVFGCIDDCPSGKNQTTFCADGIYPVIIVS